MTVFEQYKENIQNHTKSILADMAFIDIEPQEEKAELENVSHILSLDYTHPERGQFLLYLPRGFKELFVTNIYGDNWKDLTPQQIDDSLLEVLNIFSGVFLSEYFGEKTRYSMSVPALVYEESDIIELKEKYEYYFLGEGHLLKLVWMREDK